MGWALKYCDKCKKVYAGPSNKCAACNSDLLVSNYDSDVYATLNDPEKEIQLKKLFGDDADISPANTLELSATRDKETYTLTRADSADEVSSTIGSAIKVVAVIVIILSVICSVIIMISAGVVTGVAVLIGSLFTGLLAYGIGEICTLLTRMDYRIKTMNKDK